MATGGQILHMLTLIVTLVVGDRYSPKVCEEITVPMCKGIGYNYTYMPNQFNHDNQEEAGLEVHQFYPLVEILCSPDLRFFLCSVYTPICIDTYNKPLPACRSVCERAKKGCAPLMKQYGFPWPERMRCEDLPEYGDKEELCMDVASGMTTSSGIEYTTPKTLITKPTPTKSIRPNIKTPDNIPNVKPGSNVNLSTKLAAGTLPASLDGISKKTHQIERPSCPCGCREPLVNIQEHGSRYNKYYNVVMTGDIKNCAMNCHGAYFPEHARRFAEFWIGAWSILCCISTLVTLLTYFIDMQRFEYPERPIISLSACYLMISIGYITRLVAGHDAVACDGEVIRYQTTGPALCTIVFLLIYFFSMASSIWWVILSFTWFLAAGLKWGQEAISSYSQYFHLVAWMIPSIKSITILAMSSVDGDHISGICYVGNQNMNNLRGFVIAPLLLYLILGTTFLLAGFVSLFRIRDVIKQQGHQRTEKLERLMIRIGVFSVLYTVPATAVIACNFYEQHFREEWDAALTCSCSEPSTKPDYSVFMLKYFMCLVVGITSGFWVWSSKTVSSWRNFCRKICCRAPESKTKYTTVNYTTATTLTTLPAAPASTNYYAPNPSHV